MSTVLSTYFFNRSIKCCFYKILFVLTDYMLSLFVGFYTHHVYSSNSYDLEYIFETVHNIGMQIQ